MTTCHTELVVAYKYCKTNINIVNSRHASALNFLHEKLSTWSLRLTSCVFCLFFVLFSSFKGASVNDHVPRPSSGVSLQDFQALTTSLSKSTPTHNLKVSTVHTIVYLNRSCQHAIYRYCMHKRESIEIYPSS